MKLNRDIYYDLIQEVIAISSENPETIAEFILSGREPVNALRKIINKTNTIRFSSDWIKLEWDNDMMIHTYFEDPYMGRVIREAVSVVKRVEINIKELLPTDVTDLLLNNLNFTKLELTECDFSTAKLLLESRRFDYINMESDIFENLGTTHVDTEELELCGVFLENILNVQSIKTNSLITGYKNNSFSDNFFLVDINSNFQSLEKLKLSLFWANLSFNIHRVLQFLEFLNEKFTNLKLITLDFVEFRAELYICPFRNTYTTPPSVFKDLVNYESRLIYNGKVKVQLNHLINFELTFRKKRLIEAYCEGIAEELQDFEYYPCMEDENIFHDIKRSKNINNNFELNNVIRLISRNRRREF